MLFEKLSKLRLEDGAKGVYNWFGGVIGVPQAEVILAAIPTGHLGGVQFASVEKSKAVHTSQPSNFSD